MAASQTRFGFRGRVVAVDVPHLAFATGIAVWCAWFCQDAWRAQRDVENLILIVPATAAALAFYLVVAAGCFSTVGRGLEPTPRKALEAGIGGRIAGTMALLAAYAVCGPLVGFDVATFAFMLLLLLFLGERRIAVLALLPLLFCIVVIYAFGTLLAAPLPLLLFGDGG